MEEGGGPFQTVVAATVGVAGRTFSPSPHLEAGFNLDRQRATKDLAAARASS